MEILKDFHGSDTIKLKGNLRLSPHGILDISFTWHDPEGEIIFPKSPAGGRHFNLWQQTCFEAFIKLGSGVYFEINLSTNAAWNVYRFESYRSPQPPQEYTRAELLECSHANGNLEAKFLIPAADFSHVKAGLAAVLTLTSGRTTYWSTRHTGEKPDFHLPENFTLERTT